MGSSVGSPCSSCSSTTAPRGVDVVGEETPRSATGEDGLGDDGFGERGLTTGGLRRKAEVARTRGASGGGVGEGRARMGGVGRAGDLRIQPEPSMVEGSVKGVARGFEGEGGRETKPRGAWEIEAGGGGGGGGIEGGTTWRGLRAAERVGPCGSASAAGSSGFSLACSRGVTSSA